MNHPLDRFPVRDSELTQDLHCIPLDELNTASAQKEDEREEKREERKLWKDETNSH